MPKATTVRFTDEVYQRLDQASARTGMPVNSIVVAAVLEWMQRHTPTSGIETTTMPGLALPTPPRWSTIRRAMQQVVARPGAVELYPFERFSQTAKKLLTLSQAEAEKAGFPYIATEHLLLACFADQEFQSARILASLEVTEKDARAAIDRRLRGKRQKLGRPIIPTSRVKRVIEMAFGVCREMGHPRVGTGHILLALAAEGEGVAAHVLSDLGATSERIGDELRKQPDFEN